MKKSKYIYQTLIICLIIEIIATTRFFIFPDASGVLWIEQLYYLGIAFGVIVIILNGYLLWWFYKYQRRNDDTN